MMLWLALSIISGRDLSGKKWQITWSRLGNIGWIKWTGIFFHSKILPQPVNCNLVCGNDESLLQICLHCFCDEALKYIFNKINVNPLQMLECHRSRTYLSEISLTWTIIPMHKPYKTMEFHSYFFMDRLLFFSWWLDKSCLKICKQ